MVTYDIPQILNKFSFMTKNLLVALLLSFPALSFSYEAVQLVQVPLDQSIGCTRHFFRSSTAYNNVIFSVPRIIAGNGIIKTKGLQVNKVVQVAKMKNGFYDVTLYMYFPKHEERVGSSLSIYSTSDTNTCDYDKVRASLKVSKGNGEEVVPVIAPMPLTSIDVKIFGISSIGRVGGTVSGSELSKIEGEDGLTILDYDGKSLPVRFILSEAEYEKFSAQILHKNGLDAEVTVRFQGRKRAGSVTATFETEEIINNLSAAVKGGKIATSADLKMKLNDSVMNKHINIQVEDPALDQNGLFEKIKTKMIDDIASEAFGSAASKKKKEGVLMLTAKRNLGTLGFYPRFEREKKKAGTDVKDNTSHSTTTAQQVSQKECVFDTPMTKEQLSQCNNIPALVLDSIMQVRVDRLSGAVVPELEYIRQSDAAPMKTIRSIMLSIKRPEFVTGK